MNKKIENFESYNKKLVFSKATNTRLMGVTFLHSRWELSNEVDTIFLDQFFYFDSEEYGFDTYKEVISKNPNEGISKIEIENNINKMSGGLGGKLVSINLKEFKALLNYYYNFSKEKGDEIPEPLAHYNFLLDGTKLEGKELYELYEKICVSLINDYELIHYFMMRLIGKDYNPFLYLTSNKLDLSSFNSTTEGALFLEDIDLIDEKVISNKEDIYETFEKATTYKVTSIVMIGTVNHKIVSLIVVKNKKILDVKLLEDIVLLHEYAESLIRRKEYILLYELDTFSDNLDIKSNLTKKAMTNSYNLFSKTYMIFNDNNNHVREKKYQISNDTFGSYYISFSGEVIIRTTEEKNLDKLKEDLLSSNIGNSLEYISSYEETDQAFLDFLYSGEVSFLDYMNEFYD